MVVSKIILKFKTFNLFYSITLNSYTIKIKIYILPNNNDNNCPLYKKHHNKIDGIYTTRLPYTWDEIPMITPIDAEDDDGELSSMINDLVIYDIEDMVDFNIPKDNHNITETIFIIRRDGEYYLCETQGEPFVKFSANISKIDSIIKIDRNDKLKKLQEKITTNQEKLFIDK